MSGEKKIEREEERWGVVMGDERRSKRTGKSEGEAF